MNTNLINLEALKELPAAYANKMYRLNGLLAHRRLYLSNYRQL